MNSYITSQLWLPSTILVVIFGLFLSCGIFAFKYWQSLQETWKLEIELPKEIN